nr:MAG: wsv143-like protein [Marsupenaeus japonicus pemonivirus]
MRPQDEITILEDDTFWVPVDVDALASTVSNIDTTAKTFYVTLTDYILVTAVADGPQDLCRYSGVNISLHCLLSERGWWTGNSAISAVGETGKVASSVAITLAIRTLTAIKRVNVVGKDNNITPQHFRAIDSIVSDDTIGKLTENEEDNDDMILKHRAVVDKFNADLSTRLDSMVESQKIWEEEEEDEEEEEEEERYESESGRLHIGTFGGKATEGEKIRIGKIKNIRNNKNILCKINNNFGGTRPCLHSAILHPFLVHSVRYINDIYTDFIFIYALGGSPCSLTFVKVRFIQNTSFPLISVGVYDCYRGGDLLERLFWTMNGIIDLDDINFKLVCLEHLEIKERSAEGYFLAAPKSPNSSWSDIRGEDRLDWQNRWYISYYGHVAEKLLSPVDVSQSSLPSAEMYDKINWSATDGDDKASFPFQDVMSSTFLSISDALSSNKKSYHPASVEYVNRIESLASRSENIVKLSSRTLVGWTLATDLAATVSNHERLRNGRTHRGTASTVAKPVVSYVRLLKEIMKEKEILTNLLPSPFVAISARYDETIRLGEESIRLACKWVKMFKDTNNDIPVYINKPSFIELIDKLNNVKELESSSTELASCSEYSIKIFERLQSFFVSSISYEWEGQEPTRLISETRGLFIAAHIARTTAVQVPRLNLKNSDSYISATIIKPLTDGIVITTTATIHESWIQTFRSLLVLRQLIPSAVNNMKNMLHGSGSGGFEILDIIRCTLQAQMSDWWASKEMIKDRKNTPVSLLVLSTVGIRAVAVAVLEMFSILRSWDVFLRPSTWNWGVFDRALALLISAASANYAFHTTPEKIHGCVVAADRYLAGICRSFKVLYDFDFSSQLIFNLGLNDMSNRTTEHFITTYAIGYFTKTHSGGSEDSVIRWPLVPAKRDTDNQGVDKRVQEFAIGNIEKIKNPAAFAILSSFLYIEKWGMMMNHVLEEIFPSSLRANSHTSSKKRKKTDDTGDDDEREVKHREILNDENQQSTEDVENSDVSIYLGGVGDDDDDGDDMQIQLENNNTRPEDLEMFDAIGVEGYSVTSRGGKLGGLDNNAVSGLPNLELSSNNPSVTVTNLYLPPSIQSASAESLNYNIMTDIRGDLDKLLDDTRKNEQFLTYQLTTLTELIRNYEDKTKSDKTVDTIQSQLDDKIETLNRSLKMNMETQTKTIAEMVNSLSDESSNEKHNLIGRLRELIEMQKATNNQAMIHLDQMQSITASSIKSGAPFSSGGTGRLDEYSLPVMVNLERRMLAIKIIELCININIMMTQLEHFFATQGQTHELVSKKNDIMKDMKKLLSAEGNWLYRELQDTIGHQIFKQYNDLYKFFGEMGIVEAKELVRYAPTTVGADRGSSEDSEMDFCDMEVDSRLDNKLKLNIIYINLRSFHFSLQWLQSRAQSEGLLLQTINRALSQSDSRIIDAIHNQSTLNRNRYDEIIRNLSAIDMSDQWKNLTELSNYSMDRIENTFTEVFSRLENLTVLSKDTVQHLKELNSKVIEAIPDKSVEMYATDTDEEIEKFNICLSEVFEESSKEYARWYEGWIETNYTSFLTKLNDIHASLKELTNTDIGGPHVVSSIVFLTSEITSIVSSYHFRLHYEISSKLEQFEVGLRNVISGKCDDSRIRQSLDENRIETILKPILASLEYRIKSFLVKQREKINEKIIEADLLAEKLRFIVSGFVSQSIRRREARSDHSSPVDESVDESVNGRRAIAMDDSDSFHGVSSSTVGDTVYSTDQRQRRQCPRQTRLSNDNPTTPEPVGSIPNHGILEEMTRQQQEQQQQQQQQRQKAQASKSETSVRGQRKSSETFHTPTTPINHNKKCDSDAARVETSDPGQQEPMETNPIPNKAVAPKSENLSREVRLENLVKEVVAEHRLDQPIVVDRRITLKFGDGVDDKLCLTASRDSGVVNGTVPYSKAYVSWHSQDETVNNSLDRIKNRFMQHHRLQGQRRFISSDKDLQDCLTMLTADWGDIEFAEGIRFFYPEQLAEIKTASSSAFYKQGLSQFRELMRLTSQDTTPVVAADDGIPWDRRRRMPCRLNSLLYNIMAVDAKVARHIAAIAGSFRRSVTDKMTDKSVLKDGVARGLWLEMTVSASLTAARIIWERSAEIASVNRTNDAAPPHINLASDRALHRNRDVEHVARMLLVPSGPDDTTRILAAILLVTFVVDHISLYEMRVGRCLQVMASAHLDGVRVKLLGLPRDLNYKERVTKFGIEYDFDATRRILQDQRKNLAYLRNVLLDSLHSSLLVLLTFTVDTSKTVGDDNQTSYLSVLGERDVIVQKMEHELSSADGLSSDPVVLKLELDRLDERIIDLTNGHQTTECKENDNTRKKNLEDLRSNLIKKLKCFEFKKGATAIFGPGAFRVGYIVEEARRLFNNRVNVKCTSDDINIERDLSYDRLRNHRTPVSHLLLSSLYLPPSGIGTPAEGWLLSDEHGAAGIKTDAANVIVESPDSNDPLDKIARMLLIPPDSVSVNENKRRRYSNNTRMYQRTWDEGVSRSPPSSEAISNSNNEDSIAVPVAPGIVFVVPSIWKRADVLNRCLLDTDPEPISAVGTRQTGRVTLYPTQAKSVGADVWPVPSIRLLKQMLSVVSIFPERVGNTKTPASSIAHQKHELATSNLLSVLRRGTNGGNNNCNGGGLTPYSSVVNTRESSSSSSSSSIPSRSVHSQPPPPMSATLSGSSEMRAIVLPTPKDKKRDIRSEFNFFQGAGSGVALITRDLREAYSPKEMGVTEHGDNIHRSLCKALEREAGHLVPVSLRWVLGAIPSEVRNALSLSINRLGESGVKVTPPTFLTALASATWR